MTGRPPFEISDIDEFAHPNLGGGPVGHPRGYQSEILIFKV
jgi:hypothetical protein